MIHVGLDISNLPHIKGLNLSFIAYQLGKLGVDKDVSYKAIEGISSGEFEIYVNTCVRYLFSVCKIYKIDYTDYVKDNSIYIHDAIYTTLRLLGRL